ncbi:MAG: SUMF1/EgtB/PvdO family nonheme iron enzyme [Bradymonadia bacterium]
MKFERLYGLAQVAQDEATRLPEEVYAVMAGSKVLQRALTTSLMACDGNCDVATGRLLRADYVVSGAVTRTRSGVKVSMRLQSVGSGELLAAEVGVAKKKKSDMKAAARQVARRLLKPLMRKGEAAIKLHGKAPKGKEKQGRIAQRLSRHRAYTQPDTVATVLRPKAAKAGVEMILLPEGRFMMGSTDGAVDEAPVHEVSVKAFAISRTEITVAQYKACVDARACSTKGLTSDSRCNWGKPERASHPINCVHWKQAAAFAKWAGGRLPSEAEWEYAARSGGRAQAFPWGDAPATCRQAVMRDTGEDGCGMPNTQPVCSKPDGHSAQGVCDLTGNVWEWVQDIHGGYEDAPVDGSARGKGAGDSRVFRGGGWGNSAEAQRASFRSGTYPERQEKDIGFRIAVSVP